jgi:hypothetical protein
MNDNPPPASGSYRGPVLVDPANDRPGLRPDYGYTAPSRAPAPYRPWAQPSARWHGSPARDLARIVWSAASLALLVAAVAWLFRP